MQQQATSTSPELAAEPAGKKARIRMYSLVKHLSSDPGDNTYQEHLKIGLQNFLASFLIISAARTGAKVPAHYKPRGGQLKMIQKELFSGVAKDRFVEVLLGMPL